MAVENRAERRRTEREHNHVFGGPLLESDFAGLESCAILRRDADKMCGRVDSLTGSEMFGQNGIRNYAGIIFRIPWPGENRVREYLLRRDDPEVDEHGKPMRKYLWPPGRGNILLFPPGIQLQWLDDVSLPIVFCEGPKKLLALWNLAWFELAESVEMPRFLPVAVSGVWNFRGRVGKQENARGERVDEKGLLSDFARINFKGREATIWYDRNVHDNREKKGSVNHARNTFAKELRSLGARVLFCDLPADDHEINGPDDYAGKYGLGAALKLYDSRYDPKAKEQAKPAGQPSRVVISQLPDVREIAAEGPEFVVPSVIVKNTITAISGAAGSGKTTLAFLLGAGIARGAEMFGGQCQQRPVLIMTRENPLDFVGDIVRRLNIDTGPGSNLFVWGDWIEPPAPVPADPCILDWVTKSDPSPVIIIDSLIAFFTGDNENDPVQMRAFINQARLLLRAGAAAVIFLCHPGKSESSQDYRGSSDLEPAVDALYKLTNSGDTWLERLYLKAKKARFAAQKRELVLIYRDGTFVADERPVAVQESATQQLTRLLANNPGLTKKEFEALAMQKGLTQRRARQFLNEGVAIGTIIREEGTHHRMFHRLATGAELIQ
jgi:hypothetical protein